MSLSFLHSLSISLFPPLCRPSSAARRGPARPLAPCSSPSAPGGLWGGPRGRVLVLGGGVVLAGTGVPARLGRGRENWNEKGDFGQLVLSKKLHCSLELKLIRNSLNSVPSLTFREVFVVRPHLGYDRLKLFGREGEILALLEIAKLVLGNTLTTLDLRIITNDSNSEPNIFTFKSLTLTSCRS